MRNDTSTAKLILTALGVAGVLSGCKEQPALGGRADTTAEVSSSTGSGEELAYVTNEDS